MHEAQSLINHVALVLDGSSSMEEHEQKVIEVADAQIQHLALRSEELKQETRVSVYLFADTVTCLIFDMDVMRLPSIKHLYRVYGNTALVDATMKSQQDLATTSQIYGDHAFLTFVITDGMENRSRQFHASQMVNHITTPRPGWSLGFLVPQGDRYGRNDGRQYMQRLNVPADMIQTWDAADLDGFTGAGQSVTVATDSFMNSRAAGHAVTRSAFSTGPEAINTTTVTSALDPLPLDAYDVLSVGPADMQMDHFFAKEGLTYRSGKGHYLLRPQSKIQPNKQIVVVNRKSNQAFSDDTVGSPRVRDLLGLPRDVTVTITPNVNHEWKVFVQSKANNRKVLRGTEVLVRP
jgi:hypothetical protein